MHSSRLLSAALAVALKAAAQGSGPDAVLGAVGGARYQTLEGLFD